MKERILKNWTFIRVLYLIIGCAIIIQSVMYKQWIGFGFGVYFASMGLFAFGCAAGNCFGGSCETNSKQNSNVKDIDFEEVK